MSSNNRSVRDSTRSTRDSTRPARPTLSTREDDRYASYSRGRNLSYDDIATNVPGICNTSPTNRANNRWAHERAREHARYCATSRPREPSHAYLSSTDSDSEDDVKDPRLEAAAAAYRAGNPSTRQIQDLREAGRMAEYKNDKQARKNERIEADRARDRAERAARAAGGDSRAVVARGAGSEAGRDRRVVEESIHEERRVVRRRG